MPWNADTYPSDLERLRRVFKLPAEKWHLDQIRTAMGRVEREAPEAIGAVQEILDKLEGKKTDREGIYGGTGIALVRAGDLEWEAGQRGIGVEVLIQEYLEELAATLYIALPGQAQNYGTLGRS